ncbi:MAG TPA: TolC family protein [Pseudosphingobacterium sp.]|nr:TolC family protein [Pseudosphingobacterium sp.]
MKRYSFLITFLTVIFSISQASKAQTPAATLTLDEIWTIAARQNRQLQLADLGLKESGISTQEARDKRLPNLSISGNYSLNSKFLIYDHGLFSKPQDVPVSGHGYGVGYGLDFNLYSGGKEKRNIKMKEEEQHRRQIEFELQHDNVKYAIAIVYYDLYKYLQFHDFVSAEIATEKKQLTTIHNLHENGLVLKSDLLRTSVKLSQLELSLSDLEKKIELAKQRLNILMGRNEEEPLKIPYKDTVNLADIKQSSYLDYVAVALDQSPEIKIASSDIKLGELNVRQAKSTLLPKVSLYSNYNYTYPQVSFYPYSNNLWSYGQTGVRMQFAIDHLYKSKHSIAHARNLHDQQKEKANIKKDEITIKVKEAYLQQKQALESVATAEENIAQSTETVRVISNSYLNQESLLTDLLDAENVLLEAKFNLTAAQVDLKLSHIRLLAITGIL